MIRITTPVHTFTFPADPSEYDKIRITYVQNGELLLQKTQADMTFDENNTAWYRLTQEETGRFRPDSDVKLQAHVKDAEGNVYASEVIKLRVGDVLDGEEL